ncbi:hypothetical protein C0989_005367 [Termitomyces sp. Mn162]|nr:hypothetical protein C0989_005367 [Termitomyces sp. Mn162]
MLDLIQLGSEEERMVSLLDLLKASEDFTGKPTPICYAESTSTTGGKIDDSPPTPVLDSIVPVPDLVEQLRDGIERQLTAILVPIRSQFVAIVHPASTTLPFKRLHHLEKDNESQFEQECLAPVFKIMAYHLAHEQIREQTQRVPEHTAVFKRWLSPDFQKSNYHFFASSTNATKNITDFGIHSCLLPASWHGLHTPLYGDSFSVKAVIEVKTTQVLTEQILRDVTGWYYSSKEKQFVPGMAIQYVWPEEVLSNTTDDAGGAGTAIEQTRDKILRQIWSQLIEEDAEFAVLTTATSSYYFLRRRDGSGDLFISPPYRTADNVALYIWLSAALGVNGVDTDKINTPPVDKVWWNSLPTFEASGIRPA